MNERKKNIIICSIAIILIIVAATVATMKQKQKEQPNYTNLECIKKGNICTQEKINEGILVSYEVKDNVSYDFYLLSNDENTMTLIMDKNIKENIDWHVEFINIKGPLNAMKMLIEETSSWDKVKIIENYKYEDYGKDYFINRCKNEEETNYDCTSNIIPSRGYDNLTITDGLLYVDFNIPGADSMKGYEFTDLQVRARLITLEETGLTSEQVPKKWLSSNLSSNEGYWTLSSATILKTGYNSGAYAVIKNNDQTVTEPMYVQNQYNEDYKIGIRPVIVVEKKFN